MAGDMLAQAWDLARQGAEQYGGPASKYFKSALEMGWADLRRNAPDADDAEEEDPEVPMTPVNSKNLAAVGYVPKTSTLTVQFNSGPTYNYQNISLTTFKNMMAAASPGQFFYHNIRDDYGHAPIGKK